jgi:integrase
MLRVFLERIIDWGWDDAPKSCPILQADLPRVDDPLPRFLDDAQAAALMRAAAVAEPLDRLVVETLARTGLRVGELCALEANAVVLIGATQWLRVPVGKLRNDRYLPLHPVLVELLDAWRTDHAHDALLITRPDGRPLTRDVVGRIVRRVARSAGIVGAVTPHRLRHTLATQAVNRGMSLEAIAALLGHYAGDPVKTEHQLASGCLGVESGEEPVEDLLATQLSLGGGVIALSFEGGAELDGGLEERAGFADRLEVAVEPTGRAQ